MARQKRVIPASQGKRKKSKHDDVGKQQSYRKKKSEKEEWDEPYDPIWVRTTGEIIRESSLESVENNPGIRKALENMVQVFITECENHNIPEMVWKPIRQDITNLLTPFLNRL